MLTELQSRNGAYSQDRLTHAGNVINKNVETAKCLEAKLKSLVAGLQKLEKEFERNSQNYGSNADFWRGRREGIKDVLLLLVTKEKTGNIKLTKAGKEFADSLVLEEPMQRVVDKIHKKKEKQKP